MAVSIGRAVYRKAIKPYKEAAGPERPKTLRLARSGAPGREWMRITTKREMDRRDTKKKTEQRRRTPTSCGGGGGGTFLPGFRK